ncbi:MAG: ABC transporter permease [Pseudoxanthomonas mexicana]|nr:ABC transporter permease [Pseudoxanthomonas mexicana]
MPAPSFLLLGRAHAGTWWLTLQLAIGVVLGVHACQAVVTAHRERVVASGIDDAHVLVVPWMQVPHDHDPGSAAVLRTLRSVAGVLSASAANQVPYGTSAWSAHLWTEGGAARRDLASLYMVDDAFLATLGLATSRGRRFIAGEYRDDITDPQRPHADPAPALISAALANRLYGVADARGQMLYLFPGKRLQVIGVIDRIPLPATAHRADGTAVVLPVRTTRADGAHFLVRHGGDNDALASRLHTALSAAYPDVVVATPVALATLRANASRGPLRHAWAALAVCASWWLLTLGVLVFGGQRWVQEHRQEVSLRRALGATGIALGHRLRWEYLLLAIVASGLGLATVAAVLPLFVPARSSAPTPAIFVFVGACTIGLVQLAATWPIRLTRHIPPHLVSRSPSVRL